MHFTRWNPNITLDLSLLYNQIIIDYVTNQTYFLTASKCRQIQVNYLLNLSYEFKYPMTVNINKYHNILFYTFNAQADNHLSPYTGFWLPHLQEHVLSTFCYIYLMNWNNNHFVKDKLYSSFLRTNIRTIHVSNRNIHFYYASNVPAPNQIFSQ